MLSSIWHLPNLSMLTNPVLLLLLPFTFGLVLAGEIKGAKESALLLVLAGAFCWISEPTSRPYLLLAGRLLWPPVCSIGPLAAGLYMALRIVASRIEHRPR